LQTPIPFFFDKIRPAYNGPFLFGDVPALETLVAALYVIGLTVLILFLRKKLTRADTLIYAGTLTFWAFPFFLGGVVSLYRAEALLVPSVYLVRRLPLPALIVMFAGFVALAYPMALLFFRNILV
jgi:hypothetical protein